jgi:hypothetical protein
MRKFLTGLSIICFSISFLMLLYLFQDWKIPFVEYVYKISMAIPIFVSVLGVISACLSVKGITRKTLVLINSLILIYFGVLYFIAVYGFQEP